MWMLTVIQKHSLPKLPIMMRSLMMTTDTPIKLISVTPDAEKTMAYVARVSNPKNQDNEKFAGLLRYCIQHGHWSVFEAGTYDSGD